MLHLLQWLLLLRVLVNLVLVCKGLRMRLFLPVHPDAVEDDIGTNVKDEEGDLNN